MNYGERVEINGEQPHIVGLPCEGLVAIEYSRAGAVVEPANVVFLKFAARWHRLYFDFGTVFWRPSETGPEGFLAEELDASFQPVDLGVRLNVVGNRLSDLSYASLDGGARVTLEFEGGKVVNFECVSDVTTYST